MGEVYRAHDSKLGRDVAIKVLPDAFARDSERMARFQREAKVLASLNHPNIATIYGLEDSGATHALVMELVEGPTLADRIQSGPMSIGEALPIAKQICEALEYAHERGIVHRDLKPANVKVTSDDAVKILDFGLAKAIEGDPSSIDIQNSPTISRMATQAGVLLGTAAYMSPEQAKGKAVDSSRGHLGVRLRAVRDADGEDGIPGRVCDGHAGGGDTRRAGLVRASRGDTRSGSRFIAALLAKRPEATVAGYWRRAHLSRRSSCRFAGAVVRCRHTRLYAALATRVALDRRRRIGGRRGIFCFFEFPRRANGSN